jgi:hypothetical protein
MKIDSPDYNKPYSLLRAKVTLQTPAYHLFFVPSIIVRTVTLDRTVVKVT